MLGEESGEALVVKDLHQMPVVETRPLHGLLRDVEAQGADQVQLAAGGGAGAGDIAAVLWDLRLHQYDMKHRQLSPSFHAVKTHCTASPRQIQL